MKYVKGMRVHSSFVFELVRRRIRRTTINSSTVPSMDKLEGKIYSSDGRAVLDMDAGSITIEDF